MFFWTSTEYVDIFFKHALDMSVFFLLKSTRYVGIFSDKNYLCRHFFRRALDIFEFFRKAVDMSTCFQTNTRYVDIFWTSTWFFEVICKSFLFLPGVILAYTTPIYDNFFWICLENITKNRWRCGRRIIYLTANVKSIPLSFWI